MLFRTCLVVRSDQETDSVWSAHVGLGTLLVHIRKVGHQSAALNGCVVHVFVVQCFSAHVSNRNNQSDHSIIGNKYKNFALYETPSIRSQTGHGNSHMIINFLQLSLRK